MPNSYLLTVTDGVRWPTEHDLQSVAKILDGSIIILPFGWNLSQPSKAELLRIRGMVDTVPGEITNA